MKTVPDKHFADQVAFGLSQWLGCAIIDFIGDPIIGKHVQDRLAPQFKGQEMHAKKAEVVGDGAAFAIFVTTAKYFPGVIKTMQRTMQPLLGPMYEKIGNNRLQDWARRHQVDPKSDAFRAKLDQWKEFQVENFAMASFIAGTSVVTNVTTQRLYGNPRDKWIIAAGKIIGSTVTLGGTMSLRAFAPRTSHHLDEKVSKYIVQPTIRQTNKLLGIEGKVHSQEELLAAPPIGEALNPENKKWADDKVKSTVSTTVEKAPSYKAAIDKSRVENNQQASVA